MVEEEEEGQDREMVSAQTVVFRVQGRAVGSTAAASHLEEVAAPPWEGQGCGCFGCKQLQPTRQPDSC